MATKTRRLEARVDPEGEHRITEAAARTRESVSTFVLRAALNEADRVLARSDVVFMPAEQFDALMDSLDTPDEAPVLAHAARHRGFSRS